MNEQIPTIDLRTRIVDELPASGVLEYFGTTYTADQLITPAQFAAELEAAKASGARAVLVRIGEHCGGAGRASVRMFQALRDLSAGGIRTVAYVEKLAASSAVWVALACDVVVLRPCAMFAVHSGVGDPESPETRNANDITRRILRARTCAPDAVIEEGIAKRYDPIADRFNALGIPAEHAVPTGFADVIGDELTALALSRDGLSFDSPRSRKLRNPAPAPAVTGSAALACCSVTNDKIAVHAITADKIAVGELRTSNYAENGSGVPTAGAKLDHQGTALKVAPNSLVLGYTPMGETMVATAWCYIVRTTSAPYTSAGSRKHFDTVSVVDRGSSASPRYIVRVGSTTSNLLGGSVYITPVIPNGLPGFTAFTPVSLGSGATGDQDFALWSGSAWLNPSTVQWAVYMALFKECGDLRM